MTRARMITLGVLSVFTCGIWLLVLSIASNAYQTWSQQPLGPALVFPTAWELPATWTASPAASSAVTESISTPVPTITFETQTVVPPFLSCNHLPGMTILALGTDVRPGEQRSGLTDVMRAVRVDFQGQRVTTLEFPRDLWVQIPGLPHNQKLNTVYAYGGAEHGPSLAANTLNLNFGLNVDHYIVANINVFAEVVDALGGLDITIPSGGIDRRTRTDRSERLVFP